MRITARTTLPALALAVGARLRQHGIRAVLTGGACVAVHTGGEYVSRDADFVIQGVVRQAALDAALGEMGFRRVKDRYVHPSVPFYVEFPPGPLAIGSDLDIRPVELRSGRAILLALSATDSCRDRLAAFYHWNDRQSLRLAVSIAMACRVNVTVIRRWSLAEGAEALYKEFLAELARARRMRTRSANASGKSNQRSFEPGE